MQKTREEIEKIVNSVTEELSNNLILEYGDAIKTLESQSPESSGNPISKDLALIAFTTNKCREMIIESVTEILGES